MTRLLAVLILLVATILLSGCGIRGNLQTPPPIWGDESKTAEATDGEEAAETTPIDKVEEDDPGYGIRVVDQP